MIAKFGMTFLPLLFLIPIIITILHLLAPLVTEIVTLEVILEVAELLVTNRFVMLRLLSLLLVLLFLRFL